MLVWMRRSDVLNKSLLEAESMRAKAAKLNRSRAQTMATVAEKYRTIITLEKEQHDIDFNGIC